MARTDRQIRPLPTVVRTDDDVVELVTALLAVAERRQTWLLFLAADGTPVDLVVPIDDLPYEPDDHVDDLGRFIADLMPVIGADQLVVGWERPGATRLYPADWSWVDAVACVAAEHGVAVRGQVFMHADGATIIDLTEDDHGLEGVAV